MQTRVIFKLSCLLVMVDDSCLRGHGFKSRRRTLVGHDIFHIELLWGLYCSFEKTENKNEKEAGVGPFFKKTFQTKLNRKTRLQRASSSLWRNSWAESRLLRKYLRFWKNITNLTRSTFLYANNRQESSKNTPWLSLKFKGASWKCSQWFCLNGYRQTFLPTGMLWPVWPDWAIYWTLGKSLKPLPTINLPKSPPFLGIFCKGVKIGHFLVKLFLGNFYRHLAIFSGPTGCGSTLFWSN